MSKNILVAGGLGFIGSHTVIELIEAGYEPIILDDLSNSELFILDNIEKISGKRPKFYEVDCCDKEQVRPIFEENKIDGVIHFVGKKAVFESVQKPLLYYRINLVSMITVLELMDEYSVKNMVFSSSATVYGDPDQLPATEASPLKKSLSAYGSTKQMGEDILEKTFVVGRLSAISLRYFNPVGAHETALLGELPKGIPSNLMPFITQTAAGIREKITVYGDNYNTPDGTCVRDYIHVVDLAKAHVKACNYLFNVDENIYDVFNIGTGNGNSVLEVLNKFEEVNKVKVPSEIGARREGDAPSVYANCDKAEKVLGWKAELGLDKMVEDSWKWQESLKK